MVHTTIRIGRISFIHNDPVFHYFTRKPHPDVQVISAPPRDLLNMLLQRRLHVALVSSFAYITNKKELEVVPTMSIHTLGPALSSIVISRDKLKLTDQDSVAASGYSETSVKMLQIILKRRGLRTKVQTYPDLYGIQLLEKAPFALLIGDEALKSRLTGVSLVADIGEAWWNELRSAAVFSVCAASRQVATEERGLVERASRLLGEAVRASGETLNEVASKVSMRSSLPRGLLVEYFGRLRYNFDSRVEEGLEVFERELRALD